MRCSKGFNSRQKRVIRDFSISHNSDGTIGLSLLADRAENAEAQAVRVRNGRRMFDRFEIEMAEAEARRLYANLHRKFQGAELARDAVRGAAEGFGRGVAAALFGHSLRAGREVTIDVYKASPTTERVIEHDRPAAIPCPDEDHAGIW